MAHWSSMAWMLGISSWVIRESTSSSSSGRPAGHTRGSRRLDSLETAGVGHRHRLHVFDNIAADFHPAPLRHRAQGFPGLGRRQGDGHRFRAAHGGNQFLPEDLQVLFIMGSPLHSLRFLSSRLSLVYPCFDLTTRISTAQGLQHSAGQRISRATGV